MKKVILFLMLILSSLSFAAKKLYVGTNAEFAPYEYLENGKMVGFDIELMDAIGEELGYEIVWSNMSFDGLLPALQMKKIDAVIAGMSQTPERQKAVTFSMPYLLFSSDEHYVIVNEESSYVKKEELNGKKIGVQIGTMQEEFAKDLGGLPQLYNSWTGALMDLQQNKIDAVIIADVSGEEYLKTMKGIKKIDVVEENFPGASIALRKGETELAEQINQAILKIDAEGKYLEILKKYFPDKLDNYDAYKKANNL
ncbi:MULTISPECIES: basic amino acid ABC transporter substrate-binding protein [Fusobacterium]|uniref:Basic amino acid ABC transporter substrate-binding protein n=1 Tax=Fusobacterium mortiferum TaxID=850 RepID=A0A414PX73_FUSMR|nr:MULTISPECIES: basic amino acid ABC transporter substrate-binding protein [Fusobacterium]MCF2626966.1 basic amino acid ABC transporter substrate-binding protein [Fusobacterium mortiferum]MCF2698814.1 basic amino acid ABC transporter substrate-binding protein [Fusobacterium mortiferum]MCI6382557.1 basic amino acid ABC transporter substrate-binding protein [Fusobacterium mortiferum]MCI7664613.1 basic amino acid ABC transporter substrate-binding protein [Fusobacterium mortiferum]MDY2799811.1 ba